MLNICYRTDKQTFSIFSVIRLGLKPRTHSLEGCCSIQLSYRTKHFGKLNIHLTPVRFFMLLFRLLSIASAKVITFLLLCKKKLVFQFLYPLHCGIAVVGNGFDEDTIYGLKNLALKHYAGQVAHVVA